MKYLFWFLKTDRHVENGRAGQKALVWDSPITGAKSSLTYLQLKENVSWLFPANGAYIKGGMLLSCIIRFHIFFVVRNQCPG